jgi:hypothetical protein
VALRLRLRAVAAQSASRQLIARRLVGDQPAVSRARCATKDGVMRQAGRVRVSDPRFASRRRLRVSTCTRYSARLFFQVSVRQSIVVSTVEQELRCRVTTHALLPHRELQARLRRARRADACWSRRRLRRTSHRREYGASCSPRRSPLHDRAREATVNAVHARARMGHLERHVLTRGVDSVTRTAFDRAAGRFSLSSGETIKRSQAGRRRAKAPSLW